MNLTAALFCLVFTTLSVKAITVSVDRADILPVSLPDQAQSAFANNWRPLTTNYDDSNINVSPSSILDRTLAPLHPVLGKLQEHMAVSDRLKPQRRNKPQQIQFNSPSMLASFTLFSPLPPKQRIENLASTDTKTLSTEREYSFLVPPPRDILRFDVEPMKKVPVRDNDAFVRQTQFIPQAIKTDSHSPTYYIKPATYSTGVHPYSQGRPFLDNYNVQQSLIPPRQPAKQFDAQKSSNEKPYFQTSGGEVSDRFNKNIKNANNEKTFERFQTQHVPQHVVNSNYYNQINHPPHYKQSTFERDPSYLIHESHEISYVTPSTYKYRPSTYHFDNSLPETHSSSTLPPRLEYNKFVQAQSSSGMHSEGFKQFQPNLKDMTEKHLQEHSHNSANPFYLHDFQKTRYAPDINEVLPKANHPAKFNQMSTTVSPFVEHNPKVVYVRPELQQHQYPSSIIPLNINQRPQDVEYETPESVSLKHFNEQQFLLQQQLIQRDRERLREQEKRRRQELERQQQEELKKRQEEIKVLEQKHREKQRLEQVQAIKSEVARDSPVRQRYNQPVIVEEQKKVPMEQYKYIHYQQQFELPQGASERPLSPNKDDKTYAQVSVQKFEEVVTPAGAQHTTQEEFQPVIRPYRPQKPVREQIRRRKPTTTAYEPAPTETSTIYIPETQETLTDIPIQTTNAPDLTTISATEKAIRTRRPGAPLRRRRPSSTRTTTQEPNVSSQYYEDEIVKYNTPENQDFEKKKRVRPLSTNHQDSSVDGRPNRKRLGQRVKAYDKEHGDFIAVPEKVKSTEQTFKDISLTENYPAPFLKELYSSEYIPTSEKSLLIENSQAGLTENVPVEFYPETTVSSNLEYYDPTHNDHQEFYTQKIEDNLSLDHLFTKTEVNYVEATSPPVSQLSSASTTTTTTTTSTTTTTEATTSVKPISSSPKTTHRMRPVRYGNATRPRFSVKDYKSRIDYKNRVSQSSSSEAPAVTASPKVRGHKNQPAPADPNFKEASGRYKYMPRSSYRTTSTTTPTSNQIDESSSSTVSSDRTSRFTPKKRINTSHFYRSRVSGSTTASSSKQDQEHTAQSTTRPENVFSSSIRKRPSLKSRLYSPLSDRNNKASNSGVETSETQSAAETGFFAMTTDITSISSVLTEAANEIIETIDQTHNKESDKDEIEKIPIDLSDVAIDENDEKENPLLPTENEPVSIAKDHVANVQRFQEEPNQDFNEQQSTGTSKPESTTPFDIKHEEELFAKASQSVADLTSSASALYDKPGMFKAVSPASENRAISAHLKIATDEPTLPIEAFFHELSKKN